MSQEYEFEATASREQAATILRELADGIAAGSLRVDQDDDAVAIEVPETVDVEVEAETEDGDWSVEVELEWPDEGWEEIADAEDPGRPAEIETRAPGAPTATDADSDEDDRAGTPTTEDEGELDPSVVGPAAFPASLARFEVFRDRADEWRWRLVHRNGNIIATSGEGYTRKHNAEKGLRSVVRNAPEAEVVEESERE